MTCQRKPRTSRTALALGLALVNMIFTGVLLASLDVAIPALFRWVVELGVEAIKDHATLYLKVMFTFWSGLATALLLYRSSRQRKELADDSR